MNPQLAAQPLVSPLSLAQSLVAGELAQCERIFQAELAHASSHVDELLPTSVATAASDCGQCSSCWLGGRVARWTKATLCWRRRSR